jgi:hypothetical protein
MAPTYFAQQEDDEGRTEYGRDFEGRLRQRVAQAIEDDDELVAASVMFSLFSPSEIIAGASAGHSLDFGLEQAVPCFVVASKAAADQQAAKHQERETNNQKTYRELLSDSVTAEITEIEPARLDHFLEDYSKLLSTQSVAPGKVNERP